MQHHGLSRLKTPLAKVHGQGRNVHPFEKQRTKGTKPENGFLFFQSAHVHSTSRNFTRTRNETEIAKGRRQDKDPLVISGVSGRFPQTDSVDEFKHNLFNKIDMTQKQTRFPPGLKLPARFGYLKNMDKFDAEFFGIPDKQANALDPALRKLLEVTYETIVDAGINPESLKGSRTGVFVGTDGADADLFWTLKHGREELTGHAGLGNPTCLQANQVSHLMDLKGPSMVISTACSSSFYALQVAINAIENGNCDRALVGASSLNIVSHHSQSFSKIGALSPTGKSSPFDKSANGFVRSDAVVAILIERNSTAKRNYATIRGIGTNSDGIKKEGIFFPSGASQMSLYSHVYKMACVDPGEVNYVEAHGTGTPAGDPQEAMGISKFFATVPGRTQPLLIGSVKSNMGHGEAAAGLCGIVKVVIAAQTGSIPPNINFHEANENMKRIIDGSMKVVTESTPLPGKLIGLSSFGFGGTNSHLILELNCNSLKDKTNENVTNLPVLIPLSGRTEDSLKKSLDSACAASKELATITNSQFAGLVHQVYKQRIPGHDHRGYAVILPNNSQLEPNHSKVVTKIQKLESRENRPVWFVFPGMGSQWQGMGQELMRIDAFQNSVDKSRVTLKNAGVDLEQLLHKGSTGIFEDIREAFNSIAVMQIALFDTLTALGLKPSGFFGHSFGEILCAYADGGVSAEEALLIADARGRAMVEGRKEQEFEGVMAAVGLSWEDAKLRCCSGSVSDPDTDIVAACNNGPQSVTVSGKQSAVRDLVKQLKSEGIFAKEVNSCGIAAHGPLVFPASKLYLKYMKEVFQGQNYHTRIRSKRWVSTSFPQAQWKTPLAQSASPDYFVHNFNNPVLFHEAVKHVPKDAAVIEIAPQGLFQGILRSSLPSTCALFAPMQRKSDDKLLHFFTSVGDLYNAGVDADMGGLYPSVEFPVSAQTPSISHLVTWNHNSSWTVPIVENTQKYTDGIINIDLKESYKFLEGHKLNDRIVFPGTGYLLFAWKTLAASLGCDFDQLPVSFQDVFILRAIVLNHDTSTQLRCFLQKGSGTFEISESGATVVTGKINTPSTIPGKIFTEELTSFFPNANQVVLSTEDIYKDFRIRGYKFHGDFKSIKAIDVEGKRGQVCWNGNWTTLLDSILQGAFFNLVAARIQAVPVRISSLRINPVELHDFIKASGVKDSVPFVTKTHVSKTLAPGIELSAITDHVLSRKEQKGHLSISQYLFTPFFPKSEKTSNQVLKKKLKSTVSIFVDLILENHQQEQVHVCEIFTGSQNLLNPVISDIFLTQPLHHAHVTSMSTESEISKLKNSKKAESTSAFNFDKILCKSSTKELVPEMGQTDVVFLDDINLLKNVAANLKEKSWVILQNCNEVKKLNFSNIGLRIISHDSASAATLLRKVPLQTPSPIHSVSIDRKDYDWLPELKSLLSANSLDLNSRIYVYSQNNPTSGIIGLTKCLGREPGGENLRCIFDPQGSLELDFKNPLDSLRQVIEKDLLQNVVKNGEWGSYRHLPISNECLTSPTKEVEQAFVNILTLGDLSSLRWIESPPRHFSKDPVFFVNYASLNFRDIMLYTGKLPIRSEWIGDPAYTHAGVEFSGRDHLGKRVMGVATNTLATTVSSDSNSMIWPVPESWCLEEAATVPSVYATAYYALLDRGRMEPGQSVLIHSGTGGVGQAAINIALSMNCQVFTTVGTEDKRVYIRKLFPSLEETHIGNSRDCTFHEQIMRLTNGKGVDLVLNSLAEDKLQASLNCVARGGKFLEIGKFDILNNSALGMEHLAKSVNVFGIDLAAVLTNRIGGKKRIIQLVAEGIQKGVVKPLERTVFEKEGVEDAFRHMAAGKHVGKVLIQIQKDGDVATNKSSTVTVRAIGRSYFSPEKSYMIIGGLGGFGLELANWLIERGSKHLILMSRSGVKTGYQEHYIQQWKKLDVLVETPTVDLTDFSAAEQFIKSHSENGKEIGGIFNSGLVLTDALLSNQTKEMFQAVAAPKVTVTKNLDQLSRKYCHSLDYFVAFSSVAAGLGNAGQSNYGMANSEMEEICSTRKEAGLHVLAIQWGVIGDVGILAETVEEDQVFAGMNPQRIFSCLQTLDAILEQSKTNCGSTCFTSMLIGDKSGDLRASKKLSLEEAVARICSIKTDIKAIAPTTTLAELGLDSLSGTELQNLLQREYDCQLSTLKIRALTWADLKCIEQKIFLPNNKESVNLGKKNSFKSPGDENHEVLVKLHSGKLNLKKNIAPLFIVHGGDGQAFPLVPLAKTLPLDVYAFQAAPKNYGKDSQFQTLEEVAEGYIKELKVVQPEGPYNIAGYSVGGCIAYAMANILENKYQEKVQNVIILDGYCFFISQAVSLNETNVRQIMTSVLQILKPIISLSQLEEDSFLDNLHPTDSNINAKRLLELVDAILEDAQAGNKTKRDLEPDAWKYYQSIVAFGVMAHSYKPVQNLRGNMSLIKARDSSLATLGESKDYNFQQFCEDPINIFTVSADHQSILNPQNLQQTTDILEKILLLPANSKNSEEAQEDSFKIGG